MKHILIIFSILALGLSISNAEHIKKKNVPSAVASAFSSLHPNAKKVKWEKENGNYEVSFEENKVETSVLLEPSGALVETETEISVSSLPAAAANYVTTTLGGKKIKEASKIVTRDGKVTYEAEVDDVDYVFDMNGNFLKKVEEKKDKEDKDDRD